MTTYLKKYCKRKEIVTGKADLAGDQAVSIYRTLVLPSDKKGHIQMDAEHTVFTNGIGSAMAKHREIVRMYIAEGWKYDLDRNTKIVKK